MQGSLAVFVGCIGIGFGMDEYGQDVGVGGAPGGQVQRCPTVVVPCIGVGAGL